MGNQNSNQVQLASMRNLLVDAEGSKPGESAEGAKPDSSPLVIPNSATVQQDASILKKKSKAKSKSKEKRSLTPVKQTTVKIVGVSDDPGLSSLAIDLRKSQGPKKISAMDIININKTIRFVEIHQTIKPDLHDTIELIAGPILGYNIEDLNETLASSQEVVAGRLSFSDNLNNFNEKFKFRSDMYNHVLNTVKLETLKHNPRLYADRSKVILAHKIPGPKQQPESIFEVTAAAAKNREREFSPEFFTPRDSASSQHRRIDSKTLKKILGHSSVNKDGIEHSKKVSEDLRRIEGALARIEKREELSKSEFVSKSELISPGTKVPAQEATKPTSRKSSLTQARSARALSRSKSPKPDSPKNGRETSPGFVIGKPQNGTQNKKKTSTTPTREAVTKKSTTGLQSKKILSSINPKKPSVSSQASNPLSARDVKTKKIPSLNVVLDNIQERSSQQISSTDEARRQPQTARYASKKFWKEAEERPKSKSPKSQSSLTNESRQRIDSVNNLAKTLQKGPKKPSSPLANEYVKYVNTTLNQTHVDSSIPVKTFDISTRKISTPQITDHNLMRADSEEPIVMNLNLTAPEFSKPQSIKEVNNRGNYGPSNVMAVESRDTNDFSNEEDDIQPIEATLDLSAYIANSLAYQDDQLIRGLQEPREKQNLNPLMSERSYDRGGKGTITSARGLENDFGNRNYKNTEPEWGNVQISKKIESETKPKASMHTKKEVESREENEDYGDNLMGENFDENNYLEEIRKKMAKISAKNENSFERGGNPPPREIFKKESSKNFEPIPDDIETKENMSYRSNVGTMPNPNRNKIEDSNYVRRINFGSQPIH